MSNAFSRVDVNVEVRMEEVESHKLVFSIVADDGIDKISEGTHERFIIDAANFNAKVADKNK
jgi:fluoroacetyl-CoA thioesterase